MHTATFSSGVPIRHVLLRLEDLEEVFHDINTATFHIGLTALQAILMGLTCNEGLRDVTLAPRRHLDGPASYTMDFCLKTLRFV